MPFYFSTILYSQIHTPFSFFDKYVFMNNVFTEIIQEIHTVVIQFKTYFTRKGILIIFGQGDMPEQYPVRTEDFKM